MIYRVSVRALLVGSFSFGQVLPTFILGVIGSLIVGPALGWLYLRLMRNVRDTPSAILLQFIGTFGVWILAEHIGLSGVLTVVCYAIAIAREAPSMTPARLRIPSYAVWETVVFLMNVLAFVLIGLQIRPILEPLAPAVRTRYFFVAGAVLVTVILVRIAWVMTYHIGVEAEARLARLQSGRGHASADRARRVSRVVVRHARRRDARGGARAADRRAPIIRRRRARGRQRAGAFPVSRSDRAHRVLRGDRHAGDSGPHAEADAEAVQSA